MQKDNISIANNVITYSSSLPTLASGDSITIEIDLGEDLNASMNDVILKAKIAGPTGDPFEIAFGSYLDRQLTSILSSSLPGGKEMRDYFSYTAIKKVCISASNALPASGFYSGFYGCSQLEEVSFPNIPNMGNFCFQSAFRGCTHLRKFDFSSVSGLLGDSPFDNAFHDILDGTLELTAPCNQCIYINRGRYLLPAFYSKLKTLHLVGTPNQDMNFQTNNFLDADSVKEVLTKCANANMSGKTITFYSGGLTVQDDADGTIQSLYNTVVDTYGANIANLTITPYSA